MRRQRGMISVVNRKLITSCSSVFTSAPIRQIHYIHTETLFDIFSVLAASLTDNAQTCEPQVFEGSSFTDRVQEGIQKQRDVSRQESRAEDERQKRGNQSGRHRINNSVSFPVCTGSGLPCLYVGGHTLQQR